MDIAPRQAEHGQAAALSLEKRLLDPCRIKTDEKVLAIQTTRV